MSPTQFLTLLFACLLGATPAWTLASEAAPVPDVFVDDDYDATTPGWGVTHFATISAGLAAVDPGGTVHIQSGTYLGQVGVDVSVTIVGEGPTQPLLNGQGADNTLEIRADGCTIRGLEIQNVSRVGIDVLANDCLVEGSTFTSLQTGISCRDRSGLTIQDNELTLTEAPGYWGTLIARTSNVVIRNNTVHFCGFGFQVLDCGEVLIEGNLISHTSAFGYAIDYLGTNAEIHHNEILSALGGVRTNTSRVLANVRVHHNRIQETQFGIFLTGSTNGPNNVQAYANDLLDISGVGILVHVRSEIFENRLRNSDSAQTQSRAFQVPDQDASDTRIHHNLVIGFGIGIDFQNPFQPSLESFSFRDNVVIGSLNSAILDTGNQHRSPQVLRNAILGGNRGLVSQATSESGVAVGNNFANNQLAVSLTSSSSGWSFRRNSFFNNSNAVADGSASFSSLVPPSGNYWSDYAGVDGNGDGFGDSSYIIPGTAGLTDDFPYIEPPERALLWADRTSFPHDNPGAIQLRIEASPAQAGKTFVVLPSITGLSPELPLPGGRTLPIAVDTLTSFTLINLNTPPFAGFQGQLDASGSGTTTLNLPPLPSAFSDRFVFLSVVIGPPFNRPTNAIGLYVQ